MFVSFAAIYSAILADMIHGRRHILAWLLLAGVAHAEPPAKRVILLLGPPAAGKTTQAQALRGALGLPAVSMDDLRGAPTGLRDAASDEAANVLVRKRIAAKDCKRGFILDGYPFTAKQAEYFQSLLTQLGFPSPKVIHLSIPDSDAYLRTQVRGRADDTPEIAERRIVEYRREAELLLARYPEAVTIDATKPQAEVTAAIRKALGY